MFEREGGRGIVEPVQPVEPVQVADPIVACAGELRGLPGARSAAVLSAWTYQPSDAPVSPVGPLDEVVDVVLAAQRLAGWAIWCQLCAAASLLTAWTAWPPLGKDSRDGCDQTAT